MDCGCPDPKIIGVASFMERVSRLPASMTQLGNASEQRVGHWNDRRCGDGFFEALAALLAPVCDQCSVSQFADCCSCQEELMACHEADERLESCSASRAERRAEHAGVDDDSHVLMAAANASSSSSVKPSMRRASNDSRTGASESSSVVRSRASSDVPCGI